MSQPVVDEPLVSVIIPALNDVLDIAGCIEAIGAQDYPTSAIEVIVVDGASTDETVECASASGRALSVRPVRRVAQPEGSDILWSERRSPRRAGRGRRARRRPEPRPRPTTSACASGSSAARSDVGEVGGAQVATPRSARALEVGLARAQRNRLTSGFSRYRRAVVSGPAEHVWMGAFRTDDLRRLGGWDDATALNEDFELSQRYIASGQVVWFDARLRSGYLARPSLRARPAALLLRPREGDVVGAGPAAAPEAGDVARAATCCGRGRGGLGASDRLARDGRQPPRRPPSVSRPSDAPAPKGERALARSRWPASRPTASAGGLARSRVMSARRPASSTATPEAS